MSLRRWLAPLLWVGVIEVGTSWPNPPAIPGPEGSDKIIHLGMYGVLGLLAVRAARAEGTRGVRWRVALMVLIAISLFGAIDEFHQRFIPGRGMELGDWIADSCGALLGIAAFTLFTMSRQPPVETPT